ncbi:unnamed protein product [Prorocentrum cordatum]|uniref:Nocturnin n=1 Tax=Prorocentrum cordatum TaxID=2364126 RepID=A0ABN9WBH7_9DINO|nr:unnamed protein product [Polarella glacialis]
MPVRLSWRSGREERRSRHWQDRRAQSQPVLELAYAPRFRHFEFVRRGPDTDFLLNPDASPTEASGGHPFHVVCMVSYSVSSDLSHSQSPKAKTIQEQIMDGGADPSMLSWEERQKKLVRQLKMYNADVICLQGVQSVGFKERNSEADPEWFTCDDEPANNHLVHLYRDMSKANYGLVFAPVLQMPSSSALCLGNAILWKRNRWHMDAFSSIFRTAVVAVLKSKVGGPPLAACSYKPPDVWAQDFRLGRAHPGLRAAPARGARAGRPGRGGGRARRQGAVVRGLRPGAPRACAAALGGRGVRRRRGARLAQRVPVGDGLEPLDLDREALRGEGHGPHPARPGPPRARGAGRAEAMGMLEFLRAGNPSDHLLQVAAFSSASGGDHAAKEGGNAVPEGRGRAARGPPGWAPAGGGSSGPGRRQPRHGHGFQ